MARSINFYSIQTLTNLHVGSGDNNYGVIDNQVQRDVNTGLPTIHSSSLKGALREFFRLREKSHTAPAGEGGEQPNLIRHIFGIDPQDPRKGDNRKEEAGQWQFLSADLLSRPLRTDKVAYIHATSPEVLQSLIDKLQMMGLALPEGLEALARQEPANGEPWVFSEELRGAIIEELDWRAQQSDQTLPHWLKEVFGSRMTLVNSEDFRAIELPVVARNYLESGESKNLWYEELVPYDARFGVFIIQSSPFKEAFDQALAEQVQIGANASVGYGLCKITPNAKLGKPAPAQTIAL